MYLIKKRLRPEMKKNSDHTTRDYNYQINNTELSYKKEVKENDDYLKFIGKWYKKLNFNTTNNNDNTDNNESEIEYIYSQQKLNPSTEFQDFLFHNINKKINCDYAAITGDIFSLNTNIAIGHCVSQCFNMSKGIASQFKTRFNNKDTLINQRKKITEVSHLKLNDQWILYLITRNNYCEKPTYSNIFKTIKNTKKFVLKIKSQHRSCRNYARVQWDIIANMIQFIFQNLNIKIRIYSLRKSVMTKKVTLQIPIII